MHSAEGIMFDDFSPTQTKSVSLSDCSQNDAGPANAGNPPGAPTYQVLAHCSKLLATDHFGITSSSSDNHFVDNGNGDTLRASESIESHQSLADIYQSERRRLKQRLGVRSLIVVTATIEVLIKYSESRAGPTC